jgi:hypothetical protein
MNGFEKKRKVGRNDPCPCGSGKKFKRCCGSAQIGEIKRAMQNKLNQQADWRAKFGELGQTVSWDFAGYKMVGVGNRIHWSKRVKTFPDFLMEYITMTLGKDWGDSEIKKPFEERHQILQWHDRLWQFRRTLKPGGDGMIEGVPNGITLAYMLLAFDLYVLRRHLALQKQVIKRLKVKNGFQGARYELFVAATFIKAGFDIEYENEADSSCKHPEFIAKHGETGQQVSVEAKSRHRPGILGFDGRAATEEELKAGIKGLLDAALEKPAKHPYVIFIDINLPPSPKQIWEAPWFTELAESAAKAGCLTEADPRPFNQLVFTNHPFHYGKDNEPSPRPTRFSVIPKNPQIPIAQPKVLETIHEAAKKFGYIPGDFD